MSSRDDILGRIRKPQPPPTAAPGTGLRRANGLGAREVQGRAGPDGGQARRRTRRRRSRRTHPTALSGCQDRVLGDAGGPGQPAPRPRTLVRGTDAVDVGVVRAVYGVAETGSVWLTEKEFRPNTLGFLAQHLVDPLDPGRIVGNLHHAYRERAQFDARYGAFITGPSATADIERVLIHGAQGDEHPDGGAARSRLNTPQTPAVRSRRAARRCKWRRALR